MQPLYLAASFLFEETACDFNILSWYKCFFGAGHFFVVAQPAYLYTATAGTITMRDLICLVSCKSRSSLDTWLASAMDSSSCLGQLVFEHL